MSIDFLRPSRGLAAALLVLLAAPAAATFHLMQIEQVTGGMCSDPTQQAIQLRMRANNQNLVQNRRLVARDAAGANPVVLITFPGNVAVSTAGSRILVTSSAFAAAHGTTPDFTLTNLIPASYLPAGRLTFETAAGEIYWSLSWGGAAYTGPTTGNLDNDADGDFGPSFGDPLPSATGQALRFLGAANALSTNNAADYALTSGPVVYTANNGTATTLIDCLVFADNFESGDLLAWTSTVP